MMTLVSACMFLHWGGYALGSHVVNTPCFPLSISARATGNTHAPSHFLWFYPGHCTYHVNSCTVDPQAARSTPRAELTHVNLTDNWEGEEGRRGGGGRRRRKDRKRMRKRPGVITWDGHCGPTLHDPVYGQCATDPRQPQLTRWVAVTENARGRTVRRRKQRGGYMGDLTRRTSHECMQWTSRPVARGGQGVIWPLPTPPPKKKKKKKKKIAKFNAIAR